MPLDSKVITCQRAKKKSLSDLTMWNHFSNLYHLRRRIKEQSTVTERKKNPFDVEVYPTVIRGHSATRKQPYMSYKSCPARRPFTSAPLPRATMVYNAFTAGTGVPSETVFSLYRDSILRSIAEEEAPTEERVKQIFKTYIMDSPSHHRHTILRVVDYISSELEI